MRAIPWMDDSVREYLLFRGFFGSCKAFDGEKKHDRLRNLDADRIMEHLVDCLSSYEIARALETWSFLETHFFTRLDGSFTAKGTCQVLIL
jgi:WD repeat-containing protein 91